MNSIQFKTFAFVLVQSLFFFLSAPSLQIEAYDGYRSSLYPAGIQTDDRIYRGSWVSNRVNEMDWSDPRRGYVPNYSYGYYGNPNYYENRGWPGYNYGSNINYYSYPS